MYELTHSDTWLRKKALPYYLVCLMNIRDVLWGGVMCPAWIISQDSTAASGVRGSFYLESGNSITSLIQGIQRITHAPLIIYLVFNY